MEKEQDRLHKNAGEREGEELAQKEQTPPEHKASTPEKEAEKSPVSTPVSPKKPARRKLSPRKKAVIFTMVGILVLLVTILTVTLVRERIPPKLETVRDRYEALIRDSQEINDILFGKGLETYPRIYEIGKAHKVEFKGEEQNIQYYTFTDDTVGDIVAYWYYVRVREADGFVCYNVVPGEEYGWVVDGKEITAKPYRYALKTSEPLDEAALYAANGYYYYALPDYERPAFTYTMEDKQGQNLYYDYCRTDCGYRSVQQLKDAVSAVYSADYIEALFADQFAEDASGSVTAHYREYEKDGTVYLQKYNEYKGYDIAPRRFDFDSMRIAKGSRSDYVNIEIESEFLNKDGEWESETLTLSFTTENGEWYLDTPTY